MLHRILDLTSLLPEKNLQKIDLDFFKNNFNNIKKTFLQDKLCHFWFNTFFVKEEEKLPSTGGKWSVKHPRKMLTLTLEKWELDEANKDKGHKRFSSDFKVFTFSHTIGLYNTFYYK